MGIQEGEMMLIRHVALEYLRSRSSELRPGTWRTHSYALHWFTLFVGGIDVRKIRAKHVQQWLAANPTWAPSTARMRLSVLKTFFGWCVQNHYLQADPAAGVKGPAQPRGIPRELDPEDFWKILNACPDRRSEAIISLAFREGLRRGGVVNLNVEDIDRDVIVVTEKGGHQRVMPISPETAILVASYLGEWPAASGPVFRSYTTNRRLHPTTVGTMVSRIFYAAGVKERAWDGKSMHAGRHTFAGQMLDGGADLRTVSDALGHERESTTAIYLRRRKTPAQIRPFLPKYSQDEAV